MTRALPLACLPLLLGGLACESVGEDDGGLVFDVGPDFDAGPFDLGPVDLGPFDLGLTPDAGFAADATFPDATFPDAVFADAEPPDLGPPDTGCPDADGDMICDADDVCPLGDDRLDADGDGVADACDLCPLDNPDDPDGDGVCTTDDICALGDDGLDADGDTVPDACDVCPDGDDTIDTDADGVPDACDLCPVDNPDDPDQDGICTANDLCLLGDDTIDLDFDSVPDACDNCPELENPLQEDTRGIAAYPIPYQAISSTTATVAPVVLALEDDEVSAPQPVGFDFYFFGQLQPEFYVSSNGFVTFDDNGNSGCCSGGGIPNLSTPNGLVAVAWTDLYPPGGGEVRYFRVGAAPNRRLVVEFAAVPWCCSTTSSTVTAQAVFFEGSDHVEIHSTRQPGGHVYTRGLESLTGTQAAYLRDERSLDFELIEDAEGFDTELSGPDGIGDACDGYSEEQFGGSGSGEALQ